MILSIPFLTLASSDKGKSELVLLDTRNGQINMLFGFFMDLYIPLCIFLFRLLTSAIWK